MALQTAGSVFGVFHNLSKMCYSFCYAETKIQSECLHEERCTKPLGHLEAQ